VLPVSYVLPFRSEREPPDEFLRYVNALTDHVEVVLVDGSPPPVFAAINECRDRRVRHVRPDTDLDALANGKVRGVLTGLRAAAHDRIVIADDDVRYSTTALASIVASLDDADVVRPQNYFDPLPWHALLDTARTLINRTTGGDWPGTLAVRRSALMPEGYDGNALFENLELVRTVETGGGRARCRYDLMVRRLPPSTRHFWNQRVRQAYDEFARPWRLATALAVMPTLGALLSTRRRRAAASAFLLMPVLIAEVGRWRDGGRAVFPWLASVAAPLWMLERGLCAWVALGARATVGGVRYNGRVVALAANSPAVLTTRWAARRSMTARTSTGAGGSVACSPQ